MSTSIQSELDINQMTEAQQIELLSEDFKQLGNIENPSEAVQMAAVALKPFRALKYIKTLKPNIIRAAVELDPFALEQIAFTDKALSIPADVVELAISKDANVIQYLPECLITENLKLAAVKQKPKLLASFEKPSMELILAGLSSGDAEQALMVIDEEIIASLSREALLEVIEEDGNNIRFVKTPDAVMQLAAVKENPRAIRNIDPGLIIPELQELYRQDMEAQTKAREKSLKSPSNTLLRRRG